VAFPVTRKLDSPTPVTVQILRSKFQTGEWIPVYVTIPPPKRELVVEQGVRLRNTHTELVRAIKVKDQDASENPQVGSILRQGKKKWRTRRLRDPHRRQLPPWSLVPA